MRISAVLSVALLALCLLASAAQAQDATLSGRVVDSSGAVVPGVSVVLTNTATGVAADTQSNTEGLFSFPSTSPGLYSVTVALSGFANSKVDQVRVEVGEHRDLQIE